MSEETRDQTLVYLVRYGLTGWNAERRFQGHLDVPLCDEGLEQVGAVASWLARQPVHFAALYTSDLARAMQSAQAIGEPLGLAPTPAPAPREIHGGERQGVAAQEV